jgi:p-aminobenzoyl-glutamate transporter AbgT
MKWRKSSNLSLNSDPARAIYLPLSSFVYLGFAQHPFAGVAG